MQKVDHFLAQMIDALCCSGVPAEDLPLDLLLIGLQSVDHGKIAVDHGVEQLVEHGLWAETQQLLIPEQQSAVAQRGIVRIQVIRGDHGPVDKPTVLADHGERVWAQQEVELAELHLFCRVVIACRPHHHEEHIVVAFHLRPLFGLEQILHGERVQLPRSREIGDRLRVGLRDDRQRHAVIGRLRECEGFSKVLSRRKLLWHPADDVSREYRGDAVDGSARKTPAQETSKAAQTGSPSISSA